MKICSKCKIEKLYTEFYKHNITKDGFRHQCKLCILECDKQYRSSNVDKIKKRAKKYYKLNSNKLLKYGKTRYQLKSTLINEKSRNYYKQNITIIREQHKKYYQLNTLAVKEQQSNYAKTEQGKLNIRINLKKYRQTEQGKLMSKVCGHRRRALLKNNTPFGNNFTPIDIRLKLKLQHIQCVYCKTSIKEYFEIDHIIPLSKGGSNESNNIQLLCQDCNRGKDGKGTKLSHEFAKKFNMLF